MPHTTRFASPGAMLSLKRLLRPGRRLFWAALILAVGVHLGFSRMQTPSQEARVAKPLTTQFVKRRPRLTKPLELKRRPRPRRRTMQRTVVSSKARLRQGALSQSGHATGAFRSLARPRIAVARSALLDGLGLEPETLADRILQAREPQHALNVSLELLDIDALDTGQYHALVVEDPSDKRNTRGYLHIVHAYPRSIVNSVETSGGIVISVVALRGLVEAMNTYTQIKTDLGGRYTFDAKELMKIPFVLTSSGGFSFDHTVSEAENLGRYLLGGGFYIADCRHPAMGPERPSSQSFRRFIAAGLRSQGVALGRDWNWEKLPNSHPLYHCYFDFPGGPPPGVDNLSIVRFDPVDYLEGASWGGRLMAILSLKAYTAIWEADADSSWGNRGNTRQRQFGVNLIIFALTQEGSVTHRVMETVR